MAALLICQGEHISLADLKLIYGIATMSWLFPSRPGTDLAIWCIQCPNNVKLKKTSFIVFGIAHLRKPVGIGVHPCFLWPLALSPDLDSHQDRFWWRFLCQSMANPLASRLWQVSRATLCWQLWKERNDCSFNVKSMDHEAVIRKSWHHIGSHVGNNNWLKYKIVKFLLRMLGNARHSSLG